MQRTRPLRYILVGLMFALVVVGIISHAFVLLAILLVCGIVLGIVGDIVENRPTRPFAAYNRLHDRHHPHRDSENQDHAK